MDRDDAELLTKQYIAGMALSVEIRQLFQRTGASPLTILFAGFLLDSHLRETYEVGQWDRLMEVAKTTYLKVISGGKGVTDEKDYKESYKKS